MTVLIVPLDGDVEAAELGMPIIHRNNGFTAAVAKSPGGLFFIWTLLALVVTGGLAIILSARRLWNLRSRSGTLT